LQEAGLSHLQIASHVAGNLFQKMCSPHSWGLPSLLSTLTSSLYSSLYLVISMFGSLFSSYFLSRLSAEKIFLTYTR